VSGETPASTTRLEVNFTFEVSLLEAACESSEGGTDMACETFASTTRLELDRVLGQFALLHVLVDDASCDTSEAPCDDSSISTATARLKFHSVFKVPLLEAACESSKGGPNMAGETSTSSASFKVDLISKVPLLEATCESSEGGTNMACETSASTAGFDVDLILKVPLLEAACKST